MLRLWLAVVLVGFAGTANADSSARAASVASLTWRPPAERRKLSFAGEEDERPARAYVGPIFVEGKSALLLKQLPIGVQRSLAAPIGVSPMFVPDGFGLSLYARLPL